MEQSPRKFVLWFGTAVVTILAAMYFSTAHAATYQLGVDTVKPINCTNPTKRADNTTLPPADIAEVRITVTGPSFNQVVAMPGGCKATDLPLAGLSAGTYSMVGVTEDTGGRVSASSPAVPFTLLPVIAAPMAPVVLP